MILSLLMMFIFIFMSGMISLYLNRNHIMMKLLSLELIVLSSFCFFLYNFIIDNKWYMYYWFF